MKSELKNDLKLNLLVLGMLIIIAFIFFAVDYIRVQNQENTIFCIQGQTYADSGAKEYFGLGYKVISFPKYQGESKKIIGTLFMNSSMEIQKYENERMEQMNKKMQETMENIIKNMQNT